MTEEIEMVKEGLKLGQEVAKVGNQAIDVTTKAGTFLSGYISEPLKEFSGMITDKIEYRRWKNAISMAEEAQNILEQRGLPGPTRQPPFKIAHALLESGSLEEDQELKKTWNSLLANSSDSQREEVLRAYISILEEMGSLEVKVLNKIYETVSGKTNVNVYTALLPESAEIASAGEDKKKEKNPSEEINLALALLCRQELISSSVTWVGARVFSTVQLEPLGRKFVEACRY